MINVILQFLELDLVNINVSAKFYQNIPNGLKVKFHCFQNLNLGKTSTNPKCHLAITWATSCQYQCVCKISSLPLVGISSDARKLVSFDIPTRDNIHRYQCNNPIFYHGTDKGKENLGFRMLLLFFLLNLK